MAARSAAHSADLTVASLGHSTADSWVLHWVDSMAENLVAASAGMWAGSSVVTKVERWVVTMAG